MTIKIVLRLFFLAICIFLIPFPSRAAGYQKFYDLSYTNPASLNKIKKMNAILSGDILYSVYQFDGHDGPYTGSATSKTTVFYPYARFAYRLNPKWVVGFDITHLAFLDIEYPTDSIVRFSSTDTIIKDVNIAPQVSYQLTDKLALGFVLNADKLYEIELSNEVEPNGELTNKASSWAYGWGTGLSYAASPKTTFSLSYFSKLVHHPKGYSTWGSVENNNFEFNKVLIPPVYSLDITQIINPKWTLTTTLKYQQWSVFKSVELVNTALGHNVVIPLEFHNSWIGILSSAYQYNDRWTILSGAEYDTNPSSTESRYIGAPIYSSFTLFLGSEHAITNSCKLKLLYAHQFSYPNIDKPTTAGHANGRENINGTLVNMAVIFNV